MSTTKQEMDELMRISQECRKENGAAEEALKAKCQWEHMTRTAVIKEWGDPRKWNVIIPPEEGDLGDFNEGRPLNPVYYPKP